MTKYRILENRGLFYIQGYFKTITITGHFWWQKKHEIWDWYDINEHGGRPFFYNRDALKPFNTLDEAKAYATILQSEPIIHEL